MAAKVSAFYSALAFGLACLAPVAANADVITTYTLRNVTFGTGGTISGTFQIDQTTSTFVDTPTISVSGATNVTNSTVTEMNGNYSAAALISTTAEFQSVTPDYTDTLYIGLANDAGVMTLNGTISVYSDPISILYAPTSGGGATVSTQIGEVIASTPVPEPSSLYLLLPGLLGLALVHHRRRSIGT